MQIAEKEIDNIRNHINKCLSNDDIILIKSIDNEVFILNKKWITFEDVKKDFDKLSKEKELGNISMCYFNLRQKNVDMYDVSESFLDELGYILLDNYCRDFEPDFDKRLLDEYVNELNKSINDIETGKTFNNIVIADIFRDFIKKQTDDFNKMLERYNNLKEDQILYYLIDTIDLYPDYNYYGILEFSDIKLKDIDKNVLDGWDIHLGILLNKNK